MKTLKDATTFDELLDIKYGKPGTPSKLSNIYQIKSNHIVSELGIIDKFVEWKI